MNYQKINKQSLEECAEIAASSFADYAYFSNYVPDRKRRIRFLRELMKTELSVNQDQANLLMASDEQGIAAVAMLCSPTYHKPSDAAYLRAGFWRVFLAGGIKTVNEWNAMDSKAGKPCHAVKDAWYLSLLTVAPDRQGQGIGSAMLHDCIIPFVRERDGHTLTLFTNSEINRRFYAQNGFEEFDETSFAYKGHQMGSWSFRVNL